MRDFAASEEGAPDPSPVVGPVLANIQGYGVDISEPAEVGAYLSTHPELGRQLERVSRTASERLGHKASLTLELVRDPETDDEHLALYARQAEYDPDLIDLLDEVLESHENDAGPGGGWVTLTTDFQPPR